jgi:N-acetylglucosamine kinase-like BadF-type ATPase
LGDEGSGYQIGLSAIRAALAEEFGYGPPTRLTPVLRAFYQVAEMKSLFPKINSLDMSAADIAAAASFVFEEAEKNDAVASEIVSQAANDLRQLVTTALKISHLKNCEMHLWGGVFKGRHADRLIKRLREATDPNGIRIVNQSSKNAAVVFARNFPMN